MNKKIYCKEKLKPEEEFDKIRLKKLKEMVGWIEYDTENDTWDVTMQDEGYFECSNQENATILSGIEEIKALLLEKDALTQQDINNKNGVEDGN